MPQSRKILYFLGAGASLGAGATARIQGGGEIPIPTQANFWEIFLRLCRSDKRRQRIESFLFRYFFGYRRVPARTNASTRRKMLNGIDVEEVFTFLSERVRAPSTSASLRTYAERIWDDLVVETGSVFRRFEANQQTRKVFRALQRNHIRSYDSVVSFNYDTVFEESLQGHVQWKYEGIQDGARGLSVLKPHGSVNWRCDEGSIAVADAPDRCVVVAPTHLKFVGGIGNSNGPGSALGYLDQAVQIRDIWSALEGEMKDARAFVFIGYSFPIADLYFSSVLRSVLATRDTAPDIILVNPDAVAISERLLRRFAFGKPLRYFDMVQFVKAKRKDVLDQLS